MPLGPGTRLGPYEILAVIGAGGMGEVYRARDTRLQRDVAIKVLPTGLSSDPDRLARFEQEARAAAALNHPNILAVYDVGRHDGAPYLATELLEGDTLRERINAGALPVRKAIDYTVQIARGLAAAHDKGIVHRDLKPENIFITTDERVKVLDFGLAKLTQPEPAFAGITALPTTPPHTLPGIVLGTIGYMSPEQVRGVVADHRSDIFALGAILYEILAGKRAFSGEMPMDAMTAILKEDPAPLPLAERHIPPALERIVTRCLEKSPAARFKSADDLAFAFDALSTQSGQTAVVTAADTASIVWRQPAAKLWASAAALLLLASLALAWRMYFGRAPVETQVYRSTIAPPAALVGQPRLALSPDSRRLGFVAPAANGANLLWIRAFDSLTAQPLAGTDGACGPFWSPDSRFVGFHAGGKLRKIDASGGSAIALADVGACGLMHGAAWNRDDVILFTPQQGTGQIFRVSASGGGKPSAVTAIDKKEFELDHEKPFFLPDGRHFSFRPPMRRRNALPSMPVRSIRRTGQR